MNLFKKNKDQKKQDSKSNENNSDEKQEALVRSLKTNLDKLKDKFSFPMNDSLKIRQLYLPMSNKNMVICHIEGTVDKNVINEHIITPLLQMQDTISKAKNIVTTVITSVLNTAEANEAKTIQDICKHLVNGSTVILIDGEIVAISIETAGFEGRAVTEPTTETVIKGPKAAFVESASINRSLIRKQIRTPNLICELVVVGEKAPQQISVMYLKDIADPELVERVKYRISQVKSDTVLTISLLEQHIEERPYSLIPSTMVTERPDRATSFLLEGHIVLIMENSPTGLITPITFWSLFHTVEDQYLRMPYGNFIRIIRFIALMIALLTPAIYIAITTYHVEMFPTDLLLAIAATRERIPFPVLWEILFMEITFEILREAGIRIPTALGPTIGIVGALILGQAAVDANIVSPILVIVVAVTGLASFTIPDISLNITVRIFRFVLLLASAMGIFGISVILAFMIAYLVSIKSFGVPFFAPLSPHLPSSKDLLTRPPIWRQWLRPLSVSPKDTQRKDKPEGDT